MTTPYRLPTLAGFQRASERRKKEVAEAQVLVPAEPTQLQVGAQNITLPGTPTDWQQFFGAAGGVPESATLVSDATRVHPDQLPPDWNYKIAREGPGGEPLPDGALGWDPFGRPYFGPGLEGWWRGLVNRMTRPVEEIRPYEPGNISTAYPGYAPGAGQSGGNIAGVGQAVETTLQRAENAPGILAYVGRGASEFVRGVISLLGVPAQIVERGQATELASKEAGEGSPLPSITPPEGAVGGLLGVISAWVPLAHVYNSLRILTGTRALAEKQDIFADAVQASRIAYSAFWDPAVKDEYVRRLNAGEDPNLLAMELQNPIVEAIGQTINDPLNILGAGFLRPAAAGRRIASAADEFVNIADNGLREAFAAARQTAGRAAASESIERVAQAAQRASQATRDGLSHFAQDTGLFALTTHGKRAEIARRISELTSWISATAGKNVDEALEAVRAVYLMASGKMDEVSEGVLLSMRFRAPQSLFSRAGQELGVVLREALGDNPARFLDELRALKPNEVAEFASKKLGAAVDGMFPTVLERVEAGENVSPVLRALSRFDNVAKSQVYLPINRFLASVYMGMSPGYAVRNLITNTVHLLVDYGPSAIGRKPADWLTRTSRWLGGVLPEGAGRGIGAVGGELAEPSGSIFNYFLRVSQNFERGAAAAATGVTVEREMLRMLKAGRALPGLDSLIAAGMRQSDADLLPRLFVDNFGDRAAVEAAFRQAVQSGSIETYRGGLWMADDIATRTRQYGVYDEIVDGMRTGQNFDEAAARINGAFDALDQEAARVVDEIAPIPAGSPTIESVAALDEARQAGHVSEETVGLMQNRVVANQNAWEAHLEAASEMRNRAIYAAGQQGIPAPQLQAVMDRYAGLFDGTIFKATRQQAQQLVDNVWSWTRRIRDMRPNTSWRELWGQIGLPGQAPESLSRQELLDFLWDQHYRPTVANYWDSARNQIAELSEAFAEEAGKLTGTPPDSGLYARARAAMDEAVNWQRDDAATLAAADERLTAIQTAPGRTIAGTSEGPSAMLGKIKRQPPEVLQALGKDDAEVFMATGLDAEQRAALVEAAGGEQQATELIRRSLRGRTPPYSPGSVPSHARVLTESAQGLAQLRQQVLDGARSAWGQLQPVAVDANVEEALRTWLTTAEEQIAQARLIASQVANAARDFTLHNYGSKRYIDSVLSYVYPYHYWYNRTYARWLQRIVRNPEVIAAYGRYRDTLEKIHAGAPEWWRYNINTNELLGLDSDNPLFFNLEQTLNPLNGLTGVDFNDPYKRVSWWTAMLDDLNKVGPSVWSPLSIATAVALYAQGEEEAAARWAGRLIPQTAALRSLTALFGKPMEFDIFVNLFSGGLDPYERRRVGRALAAMANEGLISDEEAVDAAQAQRGAIWEAAIDRAAEERAPGQLASFFLGTGFKARSVSDITIDQFFQYYNRLWAQEPNLSPDEFRRAMDTLRAQFPFMDALLLSRKGGPARDSSFSYSVLGRIPPAQSDDFAEWANIRPELLSRFYDDKGHIERWSDADRTQFMGGMLQLAALLALPDAPTRQAWTTAKSAYSEMRASGERQFGPDIWEQIDVYYAKKDESVDDANRFLEAHPEVEAALDWKQGYIIQRPELSAYYSSIQQIEGYFLGQMYDYIERTLGAEVWDTWDEYWAMKVRGESTASFWRQHPELERYQDIKRDWIDRIAQQTAEFGSRLPEGAEAQYRSSQEAIPLQDRRLQLTQEEWRSIMGNSLYNILLDDREVPRAAMDKLEEIARSLGLDNAETLLAIFRRSGT